ncbi:hypothetical protein L3X38_032470 [Prunus dulcis]|uniref:Retroviral polymerase SH3-like domain-containing protein n=1 Tax=Prunus dulcis TaxID=3755 RepID=A0AAD4VF83_PRUDU|nr:hypothetical protein L3X38_032470 [Prunus dulcis]
MLNMSVPHHLWGHGVLAAAYLINRTPSRFLNFKTPLDVLCAHTPPISVSKLPPKVFRCVAYVHVYSHQRSKLDPCALCCVFIDYSTTQKEDSTGHQANCTKPTGRPDGDDRSHSTMHDDCMETIGSPKNETGRRVIYAKLIGRPEDDDWSPVEFLDEICPSPEECDSDIGDSCEDEIDIRPPSAL